MKTIVGTWHDTRGNLAAWGKLHLVLNQDAHVIATAQVAPRSMTFQLDVNGTLMAGSKVWSNDELDPPGTYYTATVTANGGGVIWGPQWIVIAGFDPVDLTSIPPLRMIPPLNQFSTSTIPPVFAAGVIDTPVSSELGVDPNAFMTVSDELILAPGNNVLFSGSRSQHSMTVTINAIGGAGPGPGGGAFTAGIAGTNLSGAGTTVSNQLLIAGGSNVTISRVTNAAGMTMSIIGLSQGTGQSFQAALTGGGTVGAGGPVSNRLYLAGGNNVTLSGATNASGMTVTVDAAAGGPGGGGGSVSLIEGNNITIDSTADALGTTATIHGASGGGDGGSFFVSQPGAGTNRGGLVLNAGSNIVFGQSNYTTHANSACTSLPFYLTINARQLSIVPGANISTASVTNTAGTTVTLNGAETASAGSFVAGISGGNMAGTTGMASDRLVLAGGANVTLSGSTNAGSATVSVSALPYPTLSILQGVGGTTQGASNVTLSSLRLVAGSNILLAQSGNSVTINALATAGPGGDGGGGAVSFVEGANISITQNAIAGVGTTATIGAAPAHFSAGISSVSVNTSLRTSVYGSLGPVTNQLMLVPSANMSLSGSTNVSGMTVSMSAPMGVMYRAVSASGGTASGTNVGASWIPSGIRFIAGSNIFLSAASNASSDVSVTIAAAGQTDGGAGFLAGIHTDDAPPGAGTAGNLGPVSNQLVLAAGSYVTLSGATNNEGMTASIYGFMPFGARLTNAVGGTHLGQTAGANNAALTGRLFFAAGSNLVISGATNTAQSLTLTLSPTRLSLVAGSNISLSTSSNTQGTTATVNVTGIETSGGVGAGFSAGISAGVGNTAGTTSIATNRLVLAGGANITMSGSTNASGMTASIVGAASPTLSLLTGPGTISGAANVTLQSFRLAAGSGVFLSQSSQSVTIHAPHQFNFYLNDVDGSVIGQTALTRLDELLLGAGSNVTLEGGTYTYGTGVRVGDVRIHAPGGGIGGANSQSLAPVLPFLPIQTTLNTFIKNSVLFWPIMPVALGSNYTAAVIPLLFHVGTTGTLRGSFGISLGIYTRNGSTLNAAGLTHSSWSYSTTGMFGGVAYNGNRNMVIPWNHNFDSAKDHWMAIRLTTNSTFQSMDVLGYCCQAPQAAAPWGVSAAGDQTFQPVPGWGILNSTTLPSAVPMSVLNAVADFDLNTPMMYLAGFTA